MKIIKEGRTPNTYPKKRTCPLCFTEFEYDKSDEGTETIVTSDSVFLPRYTINFQFINCPICGNQIRVS